MGNHSEISPALFYMQCLNTSKNQLNANYNFQNRQFYIPNRPVTGSSKIPIIGVKNVKTINKIAIKQRPKKAALGYSHFPSDRLKSLVS